MKSSGVLITAAAVGLLSAATGAIAAQTGQTAAPPGSPAPQSSAGGGSEEGPVRAAVLRISSVEIIRSTHGPMLDIIRVRGVTSTSGWEEAELVPLTRGAPADGLLHLILVARAPSDAMEATGFETVEAILPLEPAHPFKGVNVHSATDAVTVASMPGYAEGKPAGEDCRKCIGKTFVAKGAAAPAGRSASELVKEEQLPPIIRVIGPNDGIAATDSNPNRLTLIVNKEGKITTAVWE